MYKNGTWVSQMNQEEEDLVEIEGSEFVLDADMVIMAIGTRANDFSCMYHCKDIEVNRKNLFSSR